MLEYVYHVSASQYNQNAPPNRYTGMMLAKIFKNILVRNISITKLYNVYPHWLGTVLVDNITGMSMFAIVEILGYFGVSQV